MKTDSMTVKEIIEQAMLISQTNDKLREDNVYAWKNVHVLEQERQKQDIVIEGLKDKIERLEIALRRAQSFMV